MKPYKYQRDYLKHALPSGWFYDCDTGVGKTFMALMHAKHFRRVFGNKYLIVIAPASKIKEGGWQRTAEKLGVKIDEMVSYNSMQNLFKEHSIKQRVDMIKSSFIIFDEGHRVKNITGKWGKQAYSLTSSAMGWICLSATFASNGLEDFANYFKFKDLVSGKFDYLNKYTYWRKNIFNAIEITGERDNKVSKDWATMSRRLNKEDANEIPDLVIDTLYFKPDASYKRVKQTRVFNDEVLDNASALYARLRRLTGIKSKVEYIKDWKQDHPNDDIVVFYNFDEELDELKKALKYDYVINGHEKIYNEDMRSHGSITLANYKSGSEAIELTYASTIFMLSLPNSYTEYYQSVGRCHRNGQNKKVLVYKMIAKDTVDLAVNRALDTKQDFNVKLWYRDLTN